MICKMNVNQKHINYIILTLGVFLVFHFLLQPTEIKAEPFAVTAFSIGGKASVLTFKAVTTGEGILHLKLSAGKNRLFSKHHFPQGNSSTKVSLKGLNRQELKNGVLYFEAEFHFRNYKFEKYVGGRGKSQKRFINPVSIMCGPRQKIFVVDQGNDRIQVFDYSYRYLYEFGGFAFNNSNTEGNEAQKIRFDKPTAITTVHQRELYITDSSNNRIVRCDHLGRYIDEFANEIVRLPEGITFGNRDQIVVCDTGNDRIIRYNSPDIFSAKLGSFGRATRQFSEPVSPCFDKSGNLYVTDRGNKRIQVFDPNLRPAFEIKLEGINPTSVFVDDDYFTYITDSAKGSVVILDNKFRAVARLPQKKSSFTLSNPVSTTVTPDSRLHIVDKSKNIIAIVKIEQTMILKRGKIKVATNN